MWSPFLRFAQVVVHRASHRYMCALVHVHQAFIKRRWGSDGLQVRPDGKSFGRRFQLEHQPRFRRDWLIVRFGHVVSRGDDAVSNLDKMTEI